MSFERFNLQNVKAETVRGFLASVKPVGEPWSREERAKRMAIRYGWNADTLAAARWGIARLFEGADRAFLYRALNLGQKIE